MQRWKMVIQESLRTRSRAAAAPPGGFPRRPSPALLHPQLEVLPISSLLAMSTSHQVASPLIDNFTAIFNAASTEYYSITGKRLETHPLATQLETCRSPEAVSNLLRTQAQAFSQFRKGDEKLMAWLDPTVNIISTLSAIIEGIGLPFSPANTIFSGIGVLLGAVRDVTTSHDRIVHIFERIHFFLQRLDIYTGIPPTKDLTGLLANIMAQILCILALSTKTMTEKRIKKIWKRLMGRTSVEDALERLDALTKEETLMVVARTLEVAHHVDGNAAEIKDTVHDVDENIKETKVLTRDIGENVRVIEEVARDIDHNVKATKRATDVLQRNQLQEKLRTWLSPPDPSVNHYTACKIQHSGTATWFTQGNIFGEWKGNGSLLWIRGNPGAGKSILCSAIIEDIKDMRETNSALIAYYYFDFKDASKRGLRGLLTSLLFQLGDHDDLCRDVLYKLYNTCHDGSEQPSDAALAKYLEAILDLPGQLPIFVVLDALDECPNNTGTPSAREEVLDFVANLVGSNHSNLFLCITSRPEQDIQAVLNPLTSASCRVSLHEEVGQREDINSYIHSFVHTDRTMRRWREEDRELVISTLSERADGMFRWVYCQLDTLRRCMPSSIRKALDELPHTLDDTYERALQGIPKEKWRHAHRLFHCLVAAIRPLHVEELAEIFAIEFGPDMLPNLNECWRPENAEEAVLSTCSTLVSIIETEDSKIVQFSHFSVKEFLTSNRLRTSEVGNLRRYHIPLDAAHTILARACRAVLLQFDEKVVKRRIARFPLAHYAAQYWVDHSKYDEVELQVQDIIKQLLDPTKPYLAAWTWIHNVDRDEDPPFIDDPTEYPSKRSGTLLYYAALCGFSRLVNCLISTHEENINDKSGYRGTPLHAASYMGQIDAVRVLLNHGAELNTTNGYWGSPLCSACDGGHLDIVRLLLEHGASVEKRYGVWRVLHNASSNGQIGVVRLLLQYKVDVNLADGGNWTTLHWATNHAKLTELLLEYGADVNAKSVTGTTALHSASKKGRRDVVQVLLCYGADVHIRGAGNSTAFQIATSNGHGEVAQLLLEHGAVEE